MVQDEVCVLIVAFFYVSFCSHSPPISSLQILFSDFPLMFLLTPKSMQYSSYESLHLLCTFRIWVLLEKINLSVSHFVDQEDLHALLLNGIKEHGTACWVIQFLENKYFVLTAYLWKIWNVNIKILTVITWESGWNFSVYNFLSFFSISFIHPLYFNFWIFYIISVKQTLSGKHKKRKVLWTWINVNSDALFTWWGYKILS